MTTNQSPEYLKAQKQFMLASNDEQKLIALEEMLRQMPMHKSAEAMRSNLRERYKRLKEDMERKKKNKKGSGKLGIRKEEMQAVLIGLTGSGKSSFLASLTNAKPIISPYPYTTKQPFLGTLDYSGVRIQIIDMPAIDAEFFDPGLANTADLLIILITDPQDLKKIFPFIQKSLGEKLIVLNKIDLLSESEKRKFTSFLQSKKYNFSSYSSKTRENEDELKDKIFKCFNKIRVYTKQPGKQADNEPVILEPGSTVKDLAGKILHGFSKNIKEIKVWGPSSKFSGQKVGLDHKLKDKDIVEFRTN